MTLPDRDNISTYGGALQNYNIGVIDPTTDRDAAAANKAYGNVAMLTRTSPRCFARILTAGTGTPTLDMHMAMWGSAGGVAPVPARTGVGVMTITWPASVSDELAVAHTLALLTAALGEVTGATVWHVQVERTAGNVITVRTFNTSHALADSTGVGISVFGY